MTLNSSSSFWRSRESFRTFDARFCALADLWVFNRFSNPRAFEI